MKRLFARAALLALAMAGAQAAQAQDDPGLRGGARPGSYANPSAAIAAEIAFARLAQEKGQWTAFQETAAEDAVMFAPRMVLAQQWLDDRPNPPVPIAWQPHQVWSSCDGSLMVTSGAWQRPDAKGETKHGWFTTVWRRQEKGGYKWVFDHGDETKEPVAAPDMIAALVAQCPPRARGTKSPPDTRRKSRRREKAPLVPFDPTQREGRSNDGSLIWRVTVAPDGAHTFTARMATDGEMREIRSERVAGG